MKFNLIAQSALKKTPILFFFLALLVYLPAFVTDFAVRNDYLLLPSTLHDKQVFPETPALCKLGRPLGALLITLLSWFINQISDFRFWRLLSFLTMLVVAGLFERFLRRRCGVEAFWAQLMVVTIMFLPPTQVFILWVANFPPGSFTLLLAFLSYLLWDSAGEKPWTPWADTKMGRVLRDSLAFVLFFAALLIYPAAAVFVFCGTFCYLIFPPAKERLSLRRKVGRDVVFYGSIMAAYFVINLKLLLPWSTAYCAMVFKSYEEFSGSLYEFSLATDLWRMAVLMRDAFGYSLAGVWHPVWPSGWVVSAAVVVLGLVAIHRVRFKAMRDVRWSRKGAKVVAGLFLFLLVISPFCLAKNCVMVPGYRTLFPAMVMTTLIPFAILYRWQQVLPEKQDRWLPQGMAVVLVICFFLIAGKNVHDVVRNYSHELNFIRAKLAALSGKNLNRLLLSARQPLGQASLIERVIPFEFGFMLDLSQYLEPIANDVRARSGLRPLVVADVWDRGMVFFNDHTGLIDLDEAVLDTEDSQATAGLKLRVRLSISSEGAEIFRLGKFFAFNQVRGKQSYPFWVIPPTEIEKSWFQLDFLKGPYRLKNFAIRISTVYPYQSKTCLLQASEDGQHWQEVKVVPERLPNSSNALIFKIAEDANYPYYRFYVINLQKNAAMPVQLIGLVLNKVP